MNTAATLWCSAALGTLAGTGFLLQCVIGTLIVVGINIVLRPIVKMVDAQSKTSKDIDVSYRIKVTCNSEQALSIRTIFLRHINSQPSMTVHGISTSDAGTDNKCTVVVDVYSTEPETDKYPERNRLSNQHRTECDRRQLGTWSVNHRP